MIQIGYAIIEKDENGTFKRIHSVYTDKLRAELMIRDICSVRDSDDPFYGEIAPVTLYDSKGIPE